MAASSLAAASATGGVLALCWTALKVGALSYGGGFVIIPLMQADAVDRHGWMTDREFLNAVALGQVTPGPVVHTVAVVGYAAHGLGGALLAAAIAFAPSFLFVLVGGPRLAALRHNAHARAFLDGAGPAAIGAILGSAVPLALALTEPWQLAVLAAGAVALLSGRAGVVVTLLSRRGGRDGRGARWERPCPDMREDAAHGRRRHLRDRDHRHRPVPSCAPQARRDRARARARHQVEAVHTTVSVVLVVVGIWSISTAFV